MTLVRTSGSMDKLDDKALAMGKSIKTLGTNLTKVLKDNILGKNRNILGKSLNILGKNLNNLGQISIYWAKTSIYWAKISIY